MKPPARLRAQGLARLLAPLLAHLPPRAPARFRAGSAARCGLAALGLAAGVACAGTMAASAASATAGASPAPPATTPKRSPEGRPGLAWCRLSGVATDALCGSVQRPLDPAQPAGRQITVHFAVLPAMARNRKPDPVFFFAGGPGQSAVQLADSLSRLLARVSNRRDIVLVDQRGTGRSAPLVCEPPPPLAPLAEGGETARVTQRIRECIEGLQREPHGDLRHYTTWVAMQDVEAVRAKLGADRINLVGGSYGTRAALEYLRQFPDRVRRVVIDGVAPPDMVLPASFSGDNQAALDAVLGACEADAACAARHPQLRARWQALLASLPREVNVRHPLSGQAERFVLGRDAVLGLVRGPLYVPPLASALPLALHEAAEGRFEALFGLASAMSSGSRRALSAMAEGMHFAVICNEDGPRLAGSAEPRGADFTDMAERIYREVCRSVPKAPVPEAFYRVPASPAPVLVFSGGADPVTPPRHGERIVALLGAKARHQIVPQAGHGVLALPCVRDVVFRFIDAEDDAAAAAVDTDCAAAIPRPGVFAPPTAAVTEGSRP